MAFPSPLKAFVHDRKPRNVSKKAPRSQGAPVLEELHASSEEDANLQQSPSSLIDSNAQELSSQSSSADNGEPHTPSPQYSAARVHQTTFDTGDTASVENPIANALNTESLDPHFANLLNSLTRSAASLSVDAPKVQLAAAETMPALPTSTSAHTCPSPLDPTVSPDWSARAPPKSGNFSRETLAHARSSPTISAQSSQRTVMESSASETPVGPTTSPTLQAPKHGRRSSASKADLSPYLSRPKGISKEMKYISMLESVAQESDRATSRMGHRPTMPLAQGFAAYPPAPPPSVPPPR